MRLRQIVQTDFRCSDVTMYTKFQEANKAFVRTLRPDDVVMFVSRKGDQMLFVHGFMAIQAANDAVRTVLPSNKCRMITGNWNPHRLVEYAMQAGITLTGLMTYTAHFRRMEAEKIAERVRRRHARSLE